MSIGIMRLVDMINRVQATIKPGNVAPTATDTALVVTLSPNSPQVGGGGGTSSTVALDTATLSALETISVNNFPASQTVNGSVSVSNFPATQAVSGTVAVSNFPAPTGLTNTELRATALPVSLTSTTITGSVAVTGGLTDTQLRATALPVSGTFFQATQPISATSLPLPTGAATETTLAALNTKVTAVNTGAVTISTALPAGSNNIGTTMGPAITKGAQGTTGYTVQQLKDAGRSRISITFMAVAPATADTLLSLVKVTNGVAAAGATSIGVTAGKTLRINSITFSIKAGAAAAAFATLTLRQNPAGATVISSVIEARVDVGNTAATIGASDKVELVFPDGMEFSGTQTFGVSLAAQATTNVISISINGFEY